MAERMSDDEIRRNYRLAKDKRKQIGILADLNCCSKNKIIEILGLENSKVKGKWGGKQYPLSDEERKNIIRMHCEGLEVKEISEICGRSISAVRKITRRYDEEGGMVFTEEQTPEQNEELLRELTALTSEKSDDSESNNGSGNKQTASAIASGIMDLLFSDFRDYVVEIKASVDGYTVHVVSDSEEVLIKRRTSNHD